ncbi:SigE family RNA polymerase sigma factor [Plantactinospora sp. B6F1]|uniref:SigE family RNA polymerase sigma factor n=1 Tax=Plantactinospora sp. B6F1 TaxID=3158971 RepID=UPI00102BC633
MDAETEREFVSFVEARSHVLFRTALALAGDRHHAEDLLQTVLAKALRHWKRIQGSPEAYLRRAMYRQQVSWWRRPGHSRELSTDRVPDQRTAPDATARIDLSLALQDALRQLAPKHRAVLVLRYLEDLADDEIAHLLGCKPSTVRSQTTRALSRLRALCPDLDSLELRETRR